MAEGIRTKGYGKECISATLRISFQIDKDLRNTYMNKSYEIVHDGYNLSE